MKYPTFRTFYSVLLTHEFGQCESRPITTNSRFNFTRIPKELMEAIAR